MPPAWRFHCLIALGKRTVPHTEPQPANTHPDKFGTGRIHGLDALRAFALCLGVVFHANLAYLFPPGKWAVGVAEPSAFLVWFDFFCHSFRMEVFFLLAGFFSRLAIERKGARAFAQDRFKRIFLVLVIFAIPIKYALTLLWIWGGRHTGWLVLPPEAAGLPLPIIALGALFRERFPHVGLAHLWFLYYLSMMIVLLLAGRWLVRVSTWVASLKSALDRASTVLLNGMLAPLGFFLVLGPWMAFMEGAIVDTPDRTLVPNLTVLGLYACCFAAGYWLHGRPAIFTTWAQWGPWHCALGIGLSLLVLIGGSPAEMMVNAHGSTAGPAPFAPERWLVSTLVMAFSLPGWVGLFLRFPDRPNPTIRYVARASYWLYLAHLPVVVFFQILWVDSGWPWWLSWLMVNVVSFPILFASHQWLAEKTWIGPLLHGPKK